MNLNFVSYYYNIQCALYFVLATENAILGYTISTPTTNGHCLLLSVLVEVHVVFM